VTPEQFVDRFAARGFPPEAVRLLLAGAFPSRVPAADRARPALEARKRRLPRSTALERGRPR
jgi:hypothetical protein